MSNETRILVLGQSNSGGAQLADPDAAWPNVIAGALPDLVDSPITLPFRTFYAHAPGASAYLDRELVRDRPDIAVLMLTPFAFLVPMVGSRSTPTIWRSPPATCTSGSKAASTGQLAVAAPWAPRQTGWRDA